MGAQTSLINRLVNPFKDIEEWNISKVKKILNEYKIQDLDFGLDSKGLSLILDGDIDFSTKIVSAFGNSNGLINVLAFINGAAVVCKGKLSEKTELIFDALDFDESSNISMDEMTISFLCTFRGCIVITGQGTIPKDDLVEEITLQAYKDLNKSDNQSISKNEYIEWILKYLEKDDTECTMDYFMDKVGIKQNVKINNPLIHDKSNSKFFKEIIENSMESKIINDLMTENVITNDSLTIKSNENVMESNDIHSNQVLNDSNNDYDANLQTNNDEIVYLKDDSHLNIEKSHLDEKENNMHFNNNENTVNNENQNQLELVDLQEKEENDNESTKSKNDILLQNEPNTTEVEVEKINQDTDLVADTTRNEVESFTNYTNASDIVYKDETSNIIKEDNILINEMNLKINDIKNDIDNKPKMVDNEIVDMNNNNNKSNSNNKILSTNLQSIDKMKMNDEIINNVEEKNSNNIVKTDKDKLNVETELDIIHSVINKMETTIIESTNNEIREAGPI